MTRKGQKRRFISTSSSLGSIQGKMKSTLTYLEKEEAFNLMIDGDATPQMLANRYGCGVRQFQKLKLNGLPKSKFGVFNKRNRDPNYSEVVDLTIKDCDNHRALGLPLTGLMIGGYTAYNAEIITKDTSGLYSDLVFLVLLEQYVWT